MDYNLIFFSFTAPAVILFGIAKGAAIGSLALIATPLMLFGHAIATSTRSSFTNSYGYGLVIFLQIQKKL